MISTDYALQFSNHALTHDSGLISFLNDIDEHGHVHASEIDAWVASGDFLAMAATKIDAVVDELAASHAIASPELEQLIHIFLYVQRHYNIVRKRADYRQ